MNRATYICDECEREFAGPVWHCTTCQRHNQPDHRTCRCGEECPLPKEWFDKARDAQWNAAAKPESTSKAKPKGKQLVDSQGRPVPEPLYPVFGRRPDFTSAVQHIGLAATKLKGLLPEFFDADERRRLMETLREVQTSIQRAAPDRVCPSCGGNGCRSCAKRGWAAKSSQPQKKRRKVVWAEWTEAEEALLGTAPDREVARILGRNPGAVTLRRFQKKIPKYRRIDAAKAKLVLRQTKGNKTEAAKRLGVDRKTLARWADGGQNIKS